MVRGPLQDSNLHSLAGKPLQPLASNHFRQAGALTAAEYAHERSLMQ